METVAVKQRKATSSLRRTFSREKISVDIPQSDMIFFQLIADRMGWLVNNRQILWDKYAQSSPQHADLSDDDIMQEVRAVRYGEV